MSLVNSEWPGNVLDYMSDSIIVTAKTLREESGIPMFPSPVEEAHVRFEDSGSRHAIGRNGEMRKSDATDLFLVKNAGAAKVWQTVQRLNNVGGFGIYFDTVFGSEKRVVIHIDNRPGRIMWLCPSRDRSIEKREYVHFRFNNPGPYLDLLSVELSRL